MAEMNYEMLIDAVLGDAIELVCDLVVASQGRVELSRTSDMIFDKLARGLTDRGVRKKVVADMLGINVRSLQRRMSRLQDETAARSSTLWNAVYRYIARVGDAGRSWHEVCDLFGRNDEVYLAGLLRDMVQTGVICQQGSGYERRFVVNADVSLNELEGISTASFANIVRVSLSQHGKMSDKKLSEVLGVSLTRIRQALTELMESSEVTQVGPRSYQAAAVDLQYDIEGRQAAMLAHLQAATETIRQKIQVDSPSQALGATFSFDIWAGHPFERLIADLGQRLEQQADALWESAIDYNSRCSAEDNESYTVTFYFGQHQRD